MRLSYVYTGIYLLILTDNKCDSFYKLLGPLP